MPFTVGGEWIPSEAQEKKPTSSKKVKVQLEKRKNKLVTVVLHLPMNAEELQTLAVNIKKKLGCGGSVQEGRIEIQGDQVEKIRHILQELTIKH